MTAEAKKISDFINSHALFSTLHDDDRDMLATKATMTKLEPGDILIRQNEFNPHLFLIMAGDVKIIVDGATVANLGAGDVLGEISASGLSAPVADAVAESKVTALAFPIEVINDIAWEHQEFAEKMRDLGTERAVKSWPHPGPSDQDYS